MARTNLRTKEKRMGVDAPMYIYATEMCSSYYPKVGVKNKRVLTICGSGDQVLNAYFFGAKEVVTFDLNAHSERMLRLKIAAIKALSYNEFLKFFGKEKVNVGFSYQLYKKIRELLDKKTKEFFNYIYRINKNYGGRVAASDSFRRRNDFAFGAYLVNAYLSNGKSYLKLREVIDGKKIRFVRSGIDKIFNKLKGEKFDVINLSNVPNYFMGVCRRNGLDEMKTINYIHDKIFIGLSKILKKNGKILYVSYSSSIYPNRIAKREALISRNDGRRILESMGKFSTKRRDIKGLERGTKDKIIVMERR